MLSIHRPWWAVIVLASLTSGCAEKPAEPTSTPPTSTPASSMPSTPPEATKPAAPEPAKDAEKEKDKPGPGASKGDTPDIKIEAPKVEPPTKDAAAAAAPDGKLNDDEIAAIKTLPASDQAAALKQMVCPISDEHLGSMDAPIKITLEGKTVFLCCGSCKKDAVANPKATLAKLGGK